MSTIDSLVLREKLIKIGGNLKSHQQPCRRLYSTTDVIEWIKTTLPEAQTDGYIETNYSPLEQVVKLVNLFVSGESFESPLPHSMIPKENGIYRLRTTDVRLDGWFPLKASFIIGAIELKSDTVKKGLDKKMIEKCISVRKELNLNEEYLIGNYNDNL